MFVFTHTIAAGVGAVTNATCIGRAIDLDPREPPDDPSRPYRVLKYPPLAVWVEPVEAPVPLGAACGQRAPLNCMPITLKSAAIKDGVAFKPPIWVDGVEHKRWLGSRTAFPLGDGFCVTDFYVQGQSFLWHLWLAHLARPDDGRLQRASVLVTLTRFRDWDAVLPWAPLWRDGDDAGRAKVIAAFHRAARPSDDLEADLDRLRQLGEATMAAVPQRIRDLLD